MLIANIGVAVSRNSNGTFDAYIDTDTCSGENYENVTSKKIGELVTELIECINEEDLEYHEKHKEK